MSKTKRMVMTPAPPRPALDALIEAARKRPPMTPAEIREQRISFAYGNAAMENPRITREMVEAEHDRLYGAPQDNNRNTD